MLPAGVVIGQFFMIQTQQVQDRGMQIPEMNLALHGTCPGFISAPVHITALNPAAGKPKGKAVRIMPRFILVVAGHESRATE